MSNDFLKYTGYAVVFEEVPDEITLVFNISNCPYRCEGCHSPELWKDCGKFLKSDFTDIVEKWKPYITCVCFMGDAGSDGRELTQMCNYLHIQGLKAAIYSGCDIMKDYFKYFDYVKIGHYNPHAGALNCHTTNQRMYKKVKDAMIDITYRFQRTERRK
jgi:anaerobic ribonucleoside-triphosphate reductase activating protein